MTPRVLRTAVVFVLAATAASVVSFANESVEQYCLKSESFLAPPDSPEYRKYAPDREIDIAHLTLDVTPDFHLRTVSGKATLRFKPIAKPLEELKLDAVDLKVASVTSTETIRAYQSADKKLVITFEQPIAVGREASVTVEYSAEPVEGLYFRTPEMGYKQGEAHVFSQGEAIEARHWYPCYDAPNEKFTSEIICHVPEGMTVISNGRKVSEGKDSQTGLTVVRWSQDKPHSNYLISLVAGYFKKVEDNYRGIPLEFYTLPSEIDRAKSSFDGTKEMMAFYESEIGVPYAWAKYSQTCVNDFVAGGMENTSATTLTDDTLFAPESENLHSSEGLVAHELAHQWFGDLVTCKDWSHLWLNEGFATYYAHLYEGHKRGRDQFLYGFYHDAHEFIDRKDDTKSIVYRKFNAPMEQFSYLAYPKGSWVLRMLQAQLGDDLYRRCIKTYVERHQYGSVTTEDLNSVIEELSGQSYDQFFDQWVYHVHHPELEVKYSWDAKSKLAKISIAQNQKISEDVLLFQFPLTIRFKTKSGTSDQKIVVKNKSEDFYFPIAEAPEIVRIDPDYVVLAKVTFDMPDAMLQALLKDGSDVIGRLQAIEQLAKKKDHASVESLKGALQGDGFYAVRIEAAKALRSIHSDDAFAALTNSLRQADARVRKQVVTSIEGFYREEAFPVIQKVIEQEKNPEIVAVAVQALSAYARPQVREAVDKQLQSASYRNVLADAAVASIRSQNDPSYAPGLFALLKDKESAFTSKGFSNAVKTLAYIARNDENKDSIRLFLINQTASKKQRVQLAAIEALGTLGDPKAIPVLQTFAGAAADAPERPLAEAAISALRASKKPVDEFKDLRNEVLDLKKENRDLKADLEQLKKKVEATEKSGSEAKKKEKQESRKTAGK